MIDKFVDLVNETVDESFKRGIELFIESLEEDLATTHKIVNEGLDALLEQACSEPENLDDVTENSESSEELSELDKEIDSLSVDEIAEAMEEISQEQEEKDQKETE